MEVSIRLTRARIALVGAVLTLGACGLAYAAIPASDGVITGCYDTRTGALRVVDAEGGDACRAREQSLSWNQTGPEGPQGEQGPPGTAEAYAQIGADGSINTALSRGFDGVTVTRPQTGVYCFEGLSFLPKVAVGNGVAGLAAGVAPAQYDTVVTTAVLADPSTTFLGICDNAAGGPTPTVRVYVAGFGPSGTLEPINRNFRILLDD